MNEIEGNKLIAEFMGLRFHKTGWVDQYHIDGNFECEALRYHKSWEWLMPVVEKINGLYKRSGGERIYLHLLIWHPELIVTRLADLKINNIYNAVIEFIKYYNQKQIK